MKTMMDEKYDFSFDVSNVFQYLKVSLKMWKKITQSFTIVIAIENSQLREDHWELA